MAEQEEVLRAEGLRKSYNVGQPNEVEVLHGIDMRLDRADFAALVGPSGSGKSTLLNLIGLLDSPSGGELYLRGQPTREMDDEARTALRGRHIGFVFQFHHLIGAFSALENVLMPWMVANGRPTPEITDVARGLLADVGLEKLSDRRPDQLSGGQQQRVAIARALVTRPSLLLADEPTGNLDSKSARELMETFSVLNEVGRVTIAMVTHDPFAASYCRRILFIRDGRLYNEIHRGHSRQVFFQQILDVLAVIGGGNGENENPPPEGRETHPATARWGR